MHKRREILCIEAEPQPGAPYTLPSIGELLGLPGHSTVLTDLISTPYSALQALAVQFDRDDKHYKAGKIKLKYLLLAFQKFPDLTSDLKHQASCVLSNLELYALAALREQKVTTAARVIKAVDKALEKGLKVKYKGRHQVRLLQVHAYLALYQGKLTLAVQYIEQSKLLESKHTHVLLKCTSRLLEGYLYSLQLDSKIAMKLIRESLTIQTRHKVPELINSTQELNWFFRLLVITLHNLSVESVNLHLRQDAMQFIEKAHQIVLENTDLAPYLSNRVTRLYANLCPNAEQGNEASPLPTEISEEMKLPFLPAGREEKQGKIVEIRLEDERKDEVGRLPRVSPLGHAVPKSNGSFTAQTPSKRYRSVPPSQRRKMMS